MKIAMIAPNKGISVPPKNYGGTERSVYDLIEQLHKQGHQVVLFAEPGSACSADQIIHYPKRFAREELVEFVCGNLPDDVDVIHDNTFDAAIARARLTIPTICTFRNASKTYPVKHPVFLSKIALKKLGKGKGFYVHNGINLNDYPLQKKKENYLLFLGRPKKHKGIHHAIEVSKKAKIKLIIAGPMTDYVKDHILTDSSKYVEYVGTVGGEERIRLLQNAKCLLFPTNCFEAFGRVVIEALACGTPVITSDKGAVPEVMKGFSRYVCKSPRQMVKCLKRNKFPSPEECREYVKKRFSAKKMAKRYIRVYKEVIAKSKSNQ